MMQAPRLELEGLDADSVGSLSEPDCEHWAQCSPAAPAAPAAPARASISLAGLEFVAELDGPPVAAEPPRPIDGRCDQPVAGPAGRLTRAGCIKFRSLKRTLAILGASRIPHPRQSIQKRRPGELR